MFKKIVIINSHKQFLFNCLANRLFNLNSTFSRNFSTKLNLNRNIPETSLIEEKEIELEDKEEKIIFGKKLSDYLFKIFDIDNKTAQYLSKNEKLINFDLTEEDEDAKEKIELAAQLIDRLIELGIDRQVVKKNLFIFGLGLQIFNERFNLVNSVLSNFKSLPINIKIALLRLSIINLHKYNTNLENDKFVLGTHRVNYFSNEFGCDEQQVWLAMIKRPFTFNLKCRNFKTKIEILKSYNIDGEIILNDLWVLKTSKKSLTIRFKEAKNSKVENLKTWFGRCTSKVFSKSLDRQIKNVKAATEKESTKTISEYLSKRLKVDNSLTKFLVEVKYKELSRMNMYRVKDMCDVLFSNGYTTVDILKFPRVFCSKTTTLKLRLEYLKKKGISQPSLVLLCKSQKQFQSNAKRLINKLNQTDNQDTSTNVSPREE